MHPSRDFDTEAMDGNIGYENQHRDIKFTLI